VEPKSSSSSPETKIGAKKLQLQLGDKKLEPKSSSFNSDFN
jgi:hypothetical protein